MQVMMCTGPLALLAGFNVDIEYSFQPLGPGHRNVALGEAAIIPFLIGLLTSLAPASGCDQSPVLAIGSKHAVESDQIHPGFEWNGLQSEYLATLLRTHSYTVGHRVRMNTLHGILIQPI